MRGIIYDKYHKFLDIFLKADIHFLNKYIGNKLYDKNFFIDSNKLKVSSAQKLAKIINENFIFHSVFDIGCGIGLYLNEFFKLNKEVLGCDFSLDGIGMSPKEFTIFYADITKPIILNRKYDLVICFEVAEHINERYSAQLVSNCIKNGKIILFTAAVPGQGGVGHINEKPKLFWIKLFKKFNFEYNENLSRKVRTIMESDDIVQWLAKNFMCFQSRDSILHISNR